MKPMCEFHKIPMNLIRSNPCKLLNISSLQDNKT